MPIAATKNQLLFVAIIFFLGSNSLFFTPGKELPSMGDWFGKLSIDKIIHSFIFCGISFLFLAIVVLFSEENNIGRGVRFTIAIFSAWAVATELIQHFLIPGRTGSVMDVLADIIGVVMAFVLLKLGLVTKIFKVPVDK